MRPGRGVASIHRLHAAGLTRAEVRTLVDHRVLFRVHAGVYRVAGVPLSTRRRLFAACEAMDGLVAASHRAGLWIWGLIDEDPPIELSVLTARHPTLVGCTVHRSGDLDEHFITRRRGIPVTTPARTLVDVGCVVPAWQLRQAIERALHRRLVTIAGLRAIIDEVSGRGRNGVGVLRRTLDERALGAAHPESLLEPLVARLCDEHHVTGVRYRETLELGGRRLRPDFLIPDAKLVIEVDGLEVHGSRDALDNDLERRNLLVAHGYQVLRYTRTHLGHPEQVAAQILRTAARRRAELAASP